MDPTFKLDLETSVFSGNKNIDDFLKQTYSLKNKDKFLEWVPYENFKNVEYVAQGGFSKVYKAIWIRKGEIYRGKSDYVALKVINDSGNTDKCFLEELKYVYHLMGNRWSNVIKCYGITQDPETKNYAFIFEWIPSGNLYNFMCENFEKVTWEKKFYYLFNIVMGINEIHEKKIIHRDLHGGNILIDNRKNFENAFISDFRFSQSSSSSSTNRSRNSQVYGIIPYIAPELFKSQSYSYASDIYSLGTIMWQLTSKHKPFHDQEHGSQLILDILDGKRPEITEDTPKFWVNLMKRCWHLDPSQRPEIGEIKELIHKFNWNGYNEDYIKRFLPDKYDIFLEFKEAEEKRLEMIKSKKPFVKNPERELPNSTYSSISLNSMFEDLLADDRSLSGDSIDVMDITSERDNSSAENSNKHYLDDLIHEEEIEDTNEFKRRKIAEYFSECFASDDTTL